MTTLAVRTIDALRTEHDGLAGLVADLSEEQLSGPSGASEWSVAQVLSHLGSGGEISLASLKAALGEADAPDDDFNPSVWARWDAMSPVEQRDGFLESSRVLMERLEALTEDQHASLRVPLGFLPDPASVATYAGLRLNEVALHSWDARVALDPDAGVLDTSASVLVDHFEGDLGMLLGFLGKADRIAEPVVLALGDTGHALAIDEGVSLVGSPTEPTAVFDGPAEAALRLISGRLGPAYTPADVAVTGNVTLEQLRDVFPGF